MRELEWTTFVTDEGQEVDILYSLDHDGYEGKTWVDILRIQPYVQLSSEETKRFCEEVCE